MFIRNSRLTTSRASFQILLLGNSISVSGLSIGKRIRLPHSLASPQKRNFYPKKFLYLPEKTIFQTKTFFLSVWKNSHLAQPKKNFQRKKFLILAQTNQFFKRKKFLHRPERTDFLPEEKVSYTYPKMFFIFPEKTKFSQRKWFLIITGQKQFFKPKFSYSCLKN